MQLENRRSDRHAVGYEPDRNNDAGESESFGEKASVLRTFDSPFCRGQPKKEQEKQKERGFPVTNQRLYVFLLYRGRLIQYHKLPIINEFDMEIKVLALQHLHHCLEVVDLLRPDPNLVFLDSACTLSFVSFMSFTVFFAPSIDMPC